MRGVSAASQTAVVDRLDDLLGQEGTDPEQVGSDLFGVTALLEAEPRLRRAVTDPATPADAKSGLLHGIVGGQVSEVGQPALQAVAQPLRRLDGHERRPQQCLHIH